MRSLDHEVFLYASEDNDAPCTELITAISKEEQRTHLKANDWRKDFFAIDWNSSLPYWEIMNLRAIEEIGKRIQQKDFICLIGGNCQKPIADAFKNHLVVEFGIGYEGTFSNYRVFESYAWMHYVYGKNGQGDGGYYDAVIPNYFDPADFPFSAKKDDYFFYIGRLIRRKGVEVAADVCKRIGKKLIIAGQGAQKVEPGKLICDGFELIGDHIEFVGTVDVKRRGELMSKAQAVFVPTQYIGPFEGVHAEAMLCGTPVITTDWGVFSETVFDCRTGFRCRTIGEMMWAAMNVKNLAPAAEIREYAKMRFGLDTVRYRYQDYFKQLMDLWDKGFYTETYDPRDKREAGCFQ